MATKIVGPDRLRRGDKIDGSGVVQVQPLGTGYLVALSNGDERPFKADDKIKVERG